MKAFHWCLDFDAALTEFARVLNLDGLVCLTWNALAGCVLSINLLLITFPLKEHRPSK